MPPSVRRATDPHRFELCVYYEDTDMAGIVYYANYLKFIERARSDWVKSIGLDQNHLRENEGIIFAVRHLEADYISSARFDDQLTVETEPHAITGARVILDQRILCQNKLIFTAKVTLVAVGSAGAAARIPLELRRHVH